MYITSQAAIEAKMALWMKQAEEKRMAEGK
jgi:hypothetical protein